MLGFGGDNKRTWVLRRYAAAVRAAGWLRCGSGRMKMRSIRAGASLTGREVEMTRCNARSQTCKETRCQARAHACRHNAAHGCRTLLLISTAPPQLQVRIFRLVRVVPLSVVYLDWQTQDDMSTLWTRTRSLLSPEEGSAPWQCAQRQGETQTLDWFLIHGQTGEPYGRPGLPIRSMELLYLDQQTLNKRLNRIVF